MMSLVCKALALEVILTDQIAVRNEDEIYDQNALDTQRKLNVMH